MSIDAIEGDHELQQILWACYEYWKGMTESPSERVICYKWVQRVYEKKFAATFHQSKLQRLAYLEFLSKADTSQGGNRRYYSIASPEELAKLLQKWSL